MKHLSSIAAIISLASLSACDSSDMPIQHADSYGYITFSAQSQKILTRTNPYEAYSPERHPATMGVFGYQDNEAAEPIFRDGLIIPTRPHSTSLHTCLIQKGQR